MRRLDVRVAVSEAARAFPQSRYPGAYRIIPNGIPVEKYAPAVGAPKVRGRILFVGRAERRKGLGVLLQAFTLLRERAAARDAGRRRRDPPAAARDRPQRHRAAGRPGRRGGARLGRRRGEDRPPGGGGDRLRAVAGGRELRHRAGRGDGRRRARGRLGPARATARCCATARPGGSRRPATPSRSPTRCTTCCRTRRSGGAWLPRAAPPPPSSPGAASPAASSRPTRMPWRRRGCAACTVARQAVVRPRHPGSHHLAGAERLLVARRAGPRRRPPAV